MLASPLAWSCSIASSRRRNAWPASSRKVGSARLSAPQPRSDHGARKAITMSPAVAVWRATVVACCSELEASTPRSLLSLAGPVLEVCRLWHESAVHPWKPRTSSRRRTLRKWRRNRRDRGHHGGLSGAPERIELVGTLGTAALAGTALSVAYHDGRCEEAAADASAGGTGADRMRSARLSYSGVWRDFLAAVNGEANAARVGTRGA